MNGIEKITSRILGDAQAEADAILAEAKERCDALRADYDQKAQAEYWSLVRAGVKETEARVQNLGRTAELEARKNVLAFKQSLVDEAFAQAEEAVCNLPEEQYVDFLARQAAQAARTGMEEVLFNEKDAAGCGKKAVAKANALLKERGLYPKLTVSAETRPIRGGLILKEGDIEVNCTVEKLTQLYRGRLAAQVAELLCAQTI